MIPMGRLSTTPVVAEYRWPDNLESDSLLIDYELGGIALNDPSAGLQYQLWIAYADGVTGDVSVEAAGIPKVVLFNAPNTTEISLAFDQNMRPFIAYVQNGQARFRWYNTASGQNEITDLDPADYSPRCCLDDKRDRQTTEGDNDVILAYMRAGSLYYRQQRDRYEIEYLLKTGLTSKLLRVGMNTKNRLQFMFEDAAP